MKTLIQLTSFFSLICSIAIGQNNSESFTLDEVMRAYDRETMITLNMGFEIDGEVTPYGLINQNFVREIKKSPSGFDQYKQFRRKTWGGAALTILVPTASVVASIVLVNPAPLLIGLGGYVGGLVLLVEGSNARQKSIWLYNRDMIKNGLSK